MSLKHFLQARTWALKSLAALLTGFVLALSLPTLAFAQAASAPAEAPAAAPLSTTAQSNVVTEEAVENPFGLRGSWASSDWVKRSTLIILVIMSVASWYVIFIKLFEQHVMLKTGRAAAETFWKASSVKEGLNALEEGSALRFVAEQGIKANDHHEGTMVESIDKHTWIAMSVERAVGNVQSRLSNGMALLATVGSTSPFVGLFGTTWGIYEALVKIGLSGQASIDKVAGPVGAALLLTAIGLVVAVPAVMGYNWLVRRNKVVLDQTRAFAGDLQNVLLSGKR